MEIHYLFTPAAILAGTGAQCYFISKGLSRMKEGNDNRSKELNIQKEQLDTLINLSRETNEGLQGNTKALQKSTDALSVVLEKVSSK